ncbi:alanine--tRNA ligase [Candidatus Haliotispira prima]|uniref:Alanine--tRNA ligase n=1 Tax=Candidatus Haliotispira prima TaxID=3034016 RepID=A0ABY8ME14_9SPIO|nr:alanine--tRNA ligase [Candidatus Haliotispira prima]
MTAGKLREAYISFFKKHGHREISSKSLFPENDPTVLFTTAGMHPLVPYLLGQEHPEGNRLVNCQPCIRTGDIDEVGDSTHLTFFEMLGNWSLRDYFKEEALSMSFEFLTSKNYLNLDPDRLAVTVFAGEESETGSIPKDNEAAEIWLKLGISAERIYFLPSEDNWWGPAGRTGPCGPDSEMFYDTGVAGCGDNCRPGGCSCGKYVEIWNNVFMQYNKTAEGQYQLLTHGCVDTGMGLERTIAVLNGKTSVFETEIFQGILQAISCATERDGQIQHVYGHTESPEDCSFRIIADHLRAGIMILGDPQGVAPSNLGQGYILRRLLRRAIRHGKNLNIQGIFLRPITEVVIAEMGSAYPNLHTRKDFILSEITREEERFIQTLHKGEQELQRVLQQIRNRSQEAILPGRLAFKLYDTYGFPLELTEEIIAEAGLKVDHEGFQKAFDKHREASRKGADKVFKGGLADHSEMTTAYHTATHLLHEALRQVLGDHVVQRGSNITADRMRFDFSHPRAVTKEETAKIELLVNEQIERNLSISYKTMRLNEAKASGARALFSEQYDEEVKVYSVGDFSLEVCGGPHVESTGVLGHFKIAKEQSSSQGVRRIKAILESKH